MGAPSLLKLVSSHQAGESTEACLSSTNMKQLLQHSKSWPVTAQLPRSREAVDSQSNRNTGASAKSAIMSRKRILSANQFGVHFRHPQPSKMQNQPCPKKQAMARCPWLFPNLLNHENGFAPKFWHLCCHELGIAAMH